MNYIIEHLYLSEAKITQFLDQLSPKNLNEKATTTTKDLTIKTNTKWGMPLWLQQFLGIGEIQFGTDDKTIEAIYEKERNDLLKLLGYFKENIITKSAKQLDAQTNLEAITNIPFLATITHPFKLLVEGNNSRERLDNLKDLNRLTWEGIFSDFKIHIDTRIESYQAKTSLNTILRLNEPVMLDFWGIIEGISTENEYQSPTIIATPIYFARKIAV